MLEGKKVNLKPMEIEDLRLISDWANDPDFGGEFEPLEQVSLSEVENWFNSLGSGEKWFIIEKKDGTKIGNIMHVPDKRHFVHRDGRYTAPGNFFGQQTAADIHL